MRTREDRRFAITLHTGGTFADGELVEEATCKEYLQVRREGAREVRRVFKHDNLDMNLAVGCRLRSHRGTQFRRWATERLREYIIKGSVYLESTRSAGNVISSRRRPLPP